MILPVETPLGIAHDNLAATFLIVGTRGHALHRNGMVGHASP